jgi:hypothetical protein
LLLGLILIFIPDSSHKLFSMLFIVLSTLILITTLWRMSIISATLAGSLAAIPIIVLTLTIINRSQYTNIYRDNRYWNRNNFNQTYGKIPIPVCPGALSAIEKEVGSLQSDIQVNIGTVQQSIASGAQSVAQGISSAAQNIAPSAPAKMNVIITK